MAKPIIYKLILVLLTLTLLLVLVFNSGRFLNYKKIRNDSILTIHEASQTKTLKKFPSKFILYLVQVKECLIDHHRDAFKDGSSFDVIVLSYGKKCKIIYPDHIQFIESNTKTTWTTGRNLLFEHAIKMKSSYTYYIFLDEDIVLVNAKIPSPYNKIKTFDEKALKIINAAISPWKKFESFLKDYLPAIASIENQIRIGHIFSELKPDQMPPYLSAFKIDAQFNAFHRDVLHTMLPYNSSYDKLSWGAAQQIIRCKAFFKYHGHVVIFMPVSASNQGHSTYPKHIISLGKLCENEAKYAPSYMLTFPITKDVLKLTGYGIFPQFYNYIAPPRTIIKEYGYFNGVFS